LIPEYNGQNVNLSKKSEINPLVVHVGLSEPLKPCLIDFVLLQDKPTKPESLLKIYLPVVHLAEMDVAEVTHQLLGIIMKIPVSSPEIFTETMNGVYLTLWHHVLITSTHQNTQIAHQLNTQLQAANHHANLDIPKTLIPLIKDTEKALTLFQEFNKSKTKS